MALANTWNRFTAFFQNTGKSIVETGGGKFKTIETSSNSEKSFCKDKNLILLYGKN